MLWSPRPPPLEYLQPIYARPIGETFRTGRWTKEEKALFVQVLQTLQFHSKTNHHGTWKKMSLMVKTRTPLQCRSHAQKYFQMLGQSIDDSVGTNEQHSSTTKVVADQVRDSDEVVVEEEMNDGFDISGFAPLGLS